jgi:DNA-binding transcriptional MerR regulator
VKKKSLDPGIDSGVDTARMGETARNGESARRQKPAMFRSGELARAAGISTDTLRHYERIGVLPEAARTASGYRIYPAESLERVRIVRHALQLGFTLSELSEILRSRDRGAAPCKSVLSMLEQKLNALQERIAQLVETQRYMQALVGEWRSKIEKTHVGKRAFLLHTLNGEVAAAVEKVVRRRNQR